MASNFQPTLSDIPGEDEMMMNNDLSGAIKEDCNADLRNSFRGIMEETFASASSNSDQPEQNVQGKPNYRPFASLDDHHMEDCFGLDLEAATTEAVRAHDLIHQDSFTSVPRDQPSPTPEEAGVLSSDIKEKKPERPLSAYNLFFQLERERLIAGIEDTSFTAADVERVAIARRIQMQQDKPKRKHRRSHGKISFAELARTIANRWKSLEPDAKDLLRERAGIEKARYLRELEEWTTKHETDKNKEITYSPPQPLNNSNYHDLSNSAHTAPMSNPQFIPSQEIQVQYVPTTAPSEQMIPTVSNHSRCDVQPSWEDEIAFSNLQSQQDALDRQFLAVEHEIENFHQMQHQDESVSSRSSGYVPPAYYGGDTPSNKCGSQQMNYPIMDTNYENFPSNSVPDNYDSAGMTLSPAEAFDISGRTGVGPQQVMRMFQQMKVRDSQARRSSMQQRQQQQQQRFPNNARMQQQRQQQQQTTPQQRQRQQFPAQHSQQPPMMPSMMPSRIPSRRSMQQNNDMMFMQQQQKQQRNRQMQGADDAQMGMFLNGFEDEY